VIVVLRRKVVCALYSLEGTVKGWSLRAAGAARQCTPAGVSASGPPSGRPGQPRAFWLRGEGLLSGSLRPRGE
jgi:hypothetical protein